MLRPCSPGVSAQGGQEYVADEPGAVPMCRSQRSEQGRPGRTRWWGQVGHQENVPLSHQRTV